MDHEHQAGPVASGQVVVNLAEVETWKATKGKICLYLYLYFYCVKNTQNTIQLIPIF